MSEKELGEKPGGLVNGAGKDAKKDVKSGEAYLSLPVVFWSQKDQKWSHGGEPLMLGVRRCDVLSWKPFVLYGAQCGARFKEVTHVVLGIPSVVGGVYQGFTEYLVALPSGVLDREFGVRVLW